MDYTIEQLLREAYDEKASDLHLTVGSKPTLRINGVLLQIGDSNLTAEDTAGFLKGIINEEQYQRFQDHGELDFSFGISGVSRFRINAYKQRGTISLAVRVIPTNIPNLMELGVAPIVHTFIEKPHGLILITGPTGSGKTTTLTGMIDEINQTQAKHIITLEDPIEYLHLHGKSLINQREVGIDAKSFSTGLRAALRQDPDVILVGEMRDLETVSTAITAAETGHLVLATLHTADAINTIDRIIDVFPEAQQSQIRVQLASVLIGILSQRLVPTMDNDGRVLAMEILVNNPAVANLIRQDKVHQIKTVMQTGKGFGMQTMEMALKDLMAKGVINEVTARQIVAIWNE